jgi:hypothetical protein
MAQKVVGAQQVVIHHLDVKVQRFYVVFRNTAHFQCLVPDRVQVLFDHACFSLGIFYSLAVQFCVQPNFDVP